jgi:hypothetical protein
MKKKLPTVNTEISLIIRSYKIPIKVEDGKVIPLTIDYTEDMITKQETITIDRKNENLQLKLQEYAEKVSKYNGMQEKFTLSNGRDYINKKIITKQTV